MVALLAASPGHALSWPDVPCSEFFSFLPQAFLSDFERLSFLFFFGLWTLHYHWAVSVLCFRLCLGERDISPGLFKSRSILKMECL